MSETLTKIVAREILNDEVWSDDAWEHATSGERGRAMGAAASVLAALRDPPPAVIEAGAKALYVDNGDGYSAEEFDAMSDNSRQWLRGRFLAAWRAALDA